jgi:hypothetical protein
MRPNLPRPLYERVPLSLADRLTLAVLGAFVVALLAGLALGTPPEIHP